MNKTWKKNQQCERVLKSSNKRCALYIYVYVWVEQDLNFIIVLCHSNHISSDAQNIVSMLCCGWNSYSSFFRFNSIQLELVWIGGVKIHTSLSLAHWPTRIFIFITQRLPFSTLCITIKNNRSMYYYVSLKSDEKNE